MSETHLPEISKLSAAPPAGNPDMDAELNTIVSDQQTTGLETADQITDTCQALDNLAPWEVTRYVETLASLLKHASPGPWRLGLSGGSVVNDQVQAGPPDVARFYGGNCIFESARLADRELIVFLRNIASSLHDIHYAEKVDSINDGLLKACGQLYAENKTLRDQIKILCDEKISILP